MLATPDHLTPDQNSAEPLHLLQNTFGYADFDERASARRFHRDFHLHRLEDQEDVLLLDGVSDGLLDLPDTSGNLRFHLGRHRSVSPP